MSTSDRYTLLIKEKINDAEINIPEINYPLYINQKNSLKCSSKTNQNMYGSYSNLDLSLELSNQLEHQNSIISSIEYTSHGKRLNDDSLMSYIKSEANNTKDTQQKVRVAKKNTNDQLELVNFIPGAFITRQKHESEGSLNQSSESLNAKNQKLNCQVEKANEAIEMSDPKILEAKSNLIFDKYIQQFSTSQSKDKEDFSSSNEQMQNMCLPKGLIGADSMIKDISVSTTCKNNSSPKRIEKKVIEQSKPTSVPIDLLNCNNISNNISINNFNFQPYPNMGTKYFPLNHQHPPSLGPQYHSTYMIPNSYINYAYPVNAVHPISFPYSIENNKYYQSNQYNQSGINYQPQSQIQGKYLPIAKPSLPNYNNYPNKAIQPEKPIHDNTLSIVKLARDQNECRILQTQLEKDPSLSHKILPQLLSQFYLFCSDPFGNYLIQKVLSSLYDEEFHQVVFIVIEKFNHLSTHNFGTRVVQKLIEVGGQNHLNKLIPSIKENLLSLSKNQNGIHVILKFMAKCLKNQFIFDFVQSEICLVSKNKEGCCMIQKILEGSPTDQKVSTKSIYIKAAFN